MSSQKLAAFNQMNMERIKSGQLEKDELFNMQNNYLKNKIVSADVKEQIQGLIEKELRERFPLPSKKIFGVKDAKAREILGDILSGIEADFDLSDNRHPNTVKTGANVMRGASHIYAYLSYRNAEESVVRLALSQPTVDDDLQFEVTREEMGSDPSEETVKFKIDKQKKAESLYRKQLGEVILPA